MTLPDETLSIDTPENVIFDYQIAGLGSRFMAAAVDTIFITVLEMAVFLALIIFVDIDQIESAWVTAVIGLALFAIYWGYYIFFEIYMNGQSPGKRWMKLRVICTDGTPVTLSEVVIRNIVRLVDFLPLYYGVGVVTAFINQQSRRLGDLAAGTLVVLDRNQPIDLKGLEHPNRQIREAPRPVVEGFGPLPVEALTSEDIRLAQDYLARRKFSSIPASLRNQIFTLLMERMGVPLPLVESAGQDDLIQDVVNYILYLKVRR